MSTVKRHWILHPFLFAAFPVLSLFSVHIDRVQIADVYIPLGVVVATSFALWLALWPLLRDPRKRALAITGLVAVSFAYGPAIDTVRRVLGSTVTSGTLALILLAIVGLLGCACTLYGLRRTQRDLTRLTTFLNRTALLAIVIPAVLIGFTLARHAHHVTSGPETPVPGSGAPSGEDLPNIYYIILDAYARADILKELYNYENDGFLNELERRGFYVARKSYSNYGLTYLSLSSSLNLDYLNNLARENPTATDFFMSVQDQCRKSKVAMVLQERGYTFLSFSSGYTATSGMDADVTLRPPVAFTEFDNALIKMTPVRTILGRMAGPSQYTIHRNRILFILNRLRHLWHYGRPLFVFAHVEAPHPPFVFDADGSPVQSDRPFEVTDGQRFYEAGGTTEEYVDGYARQLTYLNRLVLQAVDGLLKHDPDSIIILQGDHGSRLRATNRLATTDLKETVAILSAYYLPHRNVEAILYETISPVNTFRVIFDQYFGGQYGLLPDRSFFCEWETPSNLVDVTDRLR